MLYLVFMAISVVVYALPISIFGWIVPYKIIATAGKHWGKINLRALELMCGLSYRIRGIENLPKKNCIVLCKHQSAWETIALRALLPPEHTWVLKRELLWTPFFGWALAALRPIAIDRSSTRRAIRMLLEEGSYWLNRGRWVVIFPEGTRVSPGERKAYGQGGAMLAKKSGYSVLPVAHNAGLFWRRRDIKKYPGKIDLVIGKPLDPADFSVAELNGRVEEWIEGTIAKLARREEGL